jgi:hypothetical protein
MMDDRIAGYGGTIGFVWFEMLGAVHTKVVLYSAQGIAFRLRTELVRQTAGDSAYNLCCHCANPLMKPQNIATVISS